MKEGIQRYADACPGEWRRHQHGAASGTYLTPGKGVMALLDSDTLRVEGYFEETKLPRIHLGDAVNVRLLGSQHALRGKWNASRPASKTATAAPAQASSPTSIRPLTGCGWPSVFGPYRARPRRATPNALPAPPRPSRWSDRHCKAVAHSGLHAERSRPDPCRCATEPSVENLMAFPQRNRG
jgi:hypothetical protein